MQHPLKEFNGLVHFGHLQKIGSSGGIHSKTQNTKPKAMANDQDQLNAFHKHDASRDLQTCQPCTARQASTPSP